MQSLPPNARSRARRRRLVRRRRTFTVLAILAVVCLALVVFLPGGSSGKTTRSTHSAVRGNAPAARRGPAPPASIEAGVEPWSLNAPVSRPAVVANGTGLTVLGGLNPAGTSLSEVSTIDTSIGTIASAGTLAAGIHDAAAATLGARTVLFGGGSPATVAGVQAISSPTIPPKGPGTASAISTLPEPRSDLAAVTMSAGQGPRPTTTAYVVGGYDGTRYLPGVLATDDGSRFSLVANLPAPVRYPAVAAVGGKIYAFGGQTASAGTTTTATDEIQMIDPAAHTATVVGHLPRALYGAAAFVIGGTIYVAGGQLPAGLTETHIEAFIPSSRSVLDAGLLPQAVAFAGYTTVSSGASTIGYLVGGEVASQSGTLAAGVASGPLRSVISLRLSPYGGPVGSMGAGSPYSGTLLIADRGNDRLIALDPARNVTWEYPSPTMPPPPGGFFFPDDAFFIKGGTGIISNQEENHTIVEIGYPSGKLLFQYGHPRVPKSSPGYLNQPDDAYLLKSGVVTVADASNNRILFISPSGAVVGQIGDGLDAHNPPKSIAYPNGDTPLENGNFLVSEIHGSWITEYTLDGKLVWTVQMPTVNYPSDPQQIGENLYLMTDYNPSGEGRVVEFDRQGHISWLYDVTSGDGMLKEPSLAERLPNGLIMVNDDYRHRVVAIDPATNSIVWQYGVTDMPGTAPGHVAIPDGFDILLANGTTPTHPQTG